MAHSDNRPSSGGCRLTTKEPHQELAPVVRDATGPLCLVFFSPGSLCLVKKFISPSCRWFEKGFFLGTLTPFSVLPPHRSPKRPKTVLSGGRLREMTWWSQTNFFRDHLYHCYGFYLDRLDTPSSFSLISENQLIFCFSAIFDTKFSRYHQFEGTSSLSSVFVQLNSVSSVKNESVICQVV